MPAKKKRNAANDNFVDLCYLYLVGLKDGDDILPFTKIGIAQSVERRIKGMETSHPFEVFCQYRHPLRSRQLALQREHDLHSHFSELRTRGEWFRILPAECEPLARDRLGPVDTTVASMLRGIERVVSGEIKPTLTRIKPLRIPATALQL